MARTSVEDPLKVHRFIVEIDGFARAGFMSCTGLEASTDVAEYREGGDNTTVKKSPGLVSFANLTLRRGQILDEGQNDMYNWAQEVHSHGSLGGQRDFRRDVDIVQYDRGNLEVQRWRIYEAFVVRYKAFSDLEGTSSDNSIEEIEIAHEGFEKVF